MFCLHITTTFEGGSDDDSPVALSTDVLSFDSEAARARAEAQFSSANGRGAIYYKLVPFSNEVRT